MSKPSDDMPEEDKYICDHIFKDLYGGDGIDRNNPNVSLQAFYCEKCLLIRVKSWPRHRYYTSQEWLEQFHKDQGDDNVSALS